MKILVVSDTHGRMDYFERAFEREQPDEIFHLGDGLGCEDEIEAVTNVPLTIVRGNCDWSSDLPADAVVTVGNHRVFLTHGHIYGVNYGLTELVAASDERNADVILFGHTHVPELTFGYYGKTICNPGSISAPRQQGKKHTYGVIEVDAAGELEIILRSIE